MTPSLRQLAQRLDVGASCHNSSGVKSPACQLEQGGSKLSPPRHPAKYVMPCLPWALTQEGIFFVLYESELKKNCIVRLILKI